MVLKVLSLEDSPNDFEMICAKLENTGYLLDIQRVDNGDDFRRMLLGETFDVILADYNLPGYDANEALRECNALCPDIPFICVSGSIGEIMAIELLKNGAVDYVLKDRMERLPFAVKRALEESEVKKARRFAEEELRLKEKAYRTLTENLPDVIIRIDGNFRYLYANPEFERITSFTATYYMGKTNREIGMTEVRAARWDQYLQSVWDTGEAITFEFEFVFHQKEAIYSFHVVPEFGESDDQMISLLIVGRDITDRKEAENALKESEERFRDVVFSMADWVWEVDEFGRYTYSSQQSYDLFKLSSEEVLGKTPFDFMPPDEAARVGAIFGEIAAHQLPIVDLENWNMGYDGKLICLLTNGLPIIDEQGILRGYRGVDKNITERKISEEALKQSEAELNFAQEIAVMGSWVLETDTGLQHWSRNLFRMLGLSPEAGSLNYEQFMSWVHPDDRHLIEEQKEIILQTRKGVSFDFRYLLPNGRIIWVQNNIEPYFEGEKLVRLNGINLNITEKKRAEQELILAKEKAEEHIRLRTALLNNMSHEIRTPMNAIMGFSELLKDAGPSEMVEYADIINTSSNQLLSLIDEVILLSRLQSEKLQLNKREFKPAEMISEVRMLFALPHLRKGLTIQENIPSQLKEMVVRGDLVKTRQVLTNFLSNAIKYTMEGSIEIGMEHREEQLLFYVQDSGIGLSEQDQSLIFDAFYRSEKAISLAIRGNGLGLSIAKGLTTLMGGEIGVASAPGKGSRFYFTIPLERIEARAVKNDPLVQFLHQSGGLRILVVDDEPFNLEYMGALLKGRAELVDFAVNGREAVEMTSRNTYDLVLMDLKMPVMDGIEATIHIKSAFPGLAVVAQSAYTFPEERELALNAGCDDLLAKPISKKNILELLAKYN
ncbi:MAG: PAS domain S-box protein [Marinilabiliales bacterium]|nr:PAS domain S-box protein [Marinilabiliales bacterium]